jgi:alpha-1,3-rhamnosyl/mannosyltransferase
MRVTLCVDALEPHLGGIGRYTWQLCERLARRDDIADLRYFSHGRLVDDPGRLLRGERVRRGRGLVRFYRTLTAARSLRSSVVHSPNYFLPSAAPTGVITVHDLSVFFYPETHPPERVQIFEREFRASLRRSAHIITDTKTIRAELIDQFGVEPEMVTAVPLGVDANFRPHDDDELSPILNSWGLANGNYGLCVSALQPRKKVRELIRAWRALPLSLRNAYPLVLAGSSGWRNDELQNEIRAAEREGWLRNLGFVDENRLPGLYAGAALFIYPSIYEGFGLPPIEAMASGVPVIVADRSCLPEVCATAACYVDPDDPITFASAIEECLTDSSWRSEATRRGLERAAEFTWDRCIEDTVGIYHKVTNQI